MRTTVVTRQSVIYVLHSPCVGAEMSIHADCSRQTCRYNSGLALESDTHQLSSTRSIVLQHNIMSVEVCLVMCCSTVVTAMHAVNVIDHDVFD
jgi:hypothetical protein